MYVAMPAVVEERNGKSKSSQWISAHHQNPSCGKTAATMLQYMQQSGQLEAAGLVGLRQKPPVFNRQTKQYRQNFRGRATLPSFYNVQLMEQAPPGTHHILPSIHSCMAYFMC
jgi:hypothetical protein